MFLNLKTILMFTLILGHLALRSQQTDFVKLVEYATKAPSGHNTQPWVFKLSTSEIEIHPDFSKSLPVADASHRELFISLGCAATNLVIAAAQFGYRTHVSIEKDNISHAYVKVRLTREKTLQNPLFEQITLRQTNRAIYDGRIINETLLDSLLETKLEEGISLKAYANSTSSFEALTHLIEEGNKLQMSNNDFKKELLNWMRFNKKQSYTNPTGLTNTVMGMPSMPGFLGRTIIGSVLKPKNQNKGDLKKIASSSHLVLFTASDSLPASFIRLGMSLEGFLLKSTRLGIAHAYMNQPCQVKSVSEKVGSIVGFTHEIPGVILRIGYAKPKPYSVRQDVSTVIEYMD